MATVDICNPVNFPNKEFFEQHRLPAGHVDFDYEYTKAYIIAAVGAVGANDEVTALEFKSTSFHPKSSPGIPRNKETWEEVLTGVLASRHALPPNPLDIDLQRPCRVIFLLNGDFWRFSQEMAPITTKHDFGDQYFDVQRHGWDGKQVVTPPAAGMPCKAISFFSKMPCPDTRVMKHGFSLNVEFATAGSESVLPITIDPDVENKGG